MAFALTTEQTDIRDAFVTGTDLVVQAGAGAGKTSTLGALAEARTDKRGLYVAFNRAIKEDAAQKFPRSVTCKTGHGLAFGSVGRRYRHRMDAPRQNARAVCQLLGINNPVRINAKTLVAPQQLARMAKETVTRFCKSADREIQAFHVPRRKGFTPAESTALAASVLPYARKAWADLNDLNGRMRFEHDHYLKIWALTDPVLRYDYICLDEAQDTNRLMTALILSQTHAKRIVVGDSAQSINGWNGSIDALNQFPGRQMTLSQSFRFGPAVAAQANIWLGHLEAPIRLRGFDKIDSRVGEVTRPDAIITRTNAGAMTEALPLMKAGRRVAIVGGGGAMEALAQAAIDLQSGRSTDHPELIAFASWEQVQDYADNEADGSDLRPLVQLIDTHGAPAVLATARALADEKGADVVVSTAHKSKGREWAAVRIGEDFENAAPKPDHNGRMYLRRDTAMICYVAVTRGRLALDCSVLDWVKDIDGMTDATN